MAVASEPAASRSVADSSAKAAEEAKKAKDGKKKCNAKNAPKENKKAQKKKVAEQQPDCQQAAGQGDHNRGHKTAKPLPHVEELKLFQNNNLLNQQDPIQQLQAQLNELIRNDDSIRPQTIPAQPAPETANRLSANEQSKAISDTTYANGISLQQQQQQRNSANLGAFEGESDNSLTVKKGVLWQQQNYDKFHQRLFSRWKKRFFILTTGYLVCFKRSTCKVGRSEMGKFLYKVSTIIIRKLAGDIWLPNFSLDIGLLRRSYRAPAISELVRVFLEGYDMKIRFGSELTSVVEQ